MKALRKGSRGDDVERWQNFLRGQDFDEVFHLVEADGVFEDTTERATKAFQRHYGLQADGAVGNRTYAKAMELGLDVVEDPTEEETGPNWPAPPANLQPLVSNEERMKIFGSFQFVSDPKPGNAEAIRITDGWERDNIVKIEIPQLKGVSNAPQNRNVRFHAKVADQAAALFKAWQEEGLVAHVLTWGGAYVSRYVRGSRQTLSNHAFGSAFDINVSWNRLGIRPALKGQEGSVRELVSLANQHGFYWGGHYRSRPDGMHFEFPADQDEPAARISTAAVSPSRWPRRRRSTRRRTCLTRVRTRTCMPFRPFSGASSFQGAAGASRDG
jgi:hypothetical protein